MKEKQERSAKELEISRATAAGISGIEQTGSARISRCPYSASPCPL
jgi:hypothetical protein